MKRHRGCLWEGLAIFFALSFMVEGNWFASFAVLTIILLWRFRRHLYRLARSVVYWLLNQIKGLLVSIWSRVYRRRPPQKPDFDNINWHEFERLVGHLFESKGYRIQYTARTADQGLDIIAEDSRHRIGIQCKYYSSSVGNDAVMAVIAGSKYYRCNRSIVVTNSSFTRAAVELADKTGVELWDRDRLEREI